MLYGILLLVLILVSTDTISFPSVEVRFLYFLNHGTMWVGIYKENLNLLMPICLVYSSCMEELI